MESLANNTEGFNGAEIEECIKEAMFDAYVENPENPQLKTTHLMNAILKTVPLSTTMKEQIAALRNWAATRAKNASIIVREEEQKEMPILLTRPELELERSFDLNNSKENKFGVYNSVAPPLAIPNREVKPERADGTAMRCGE